MEKTIATALVCLFEYRETVIERQSQRYLIDIYVYFQLCFRIWNSYLYSGNWASQAVLVVKNLPAPCRRPKLDAGSIPGWGRSPGEGNGCPFQYSCLENPMDRGAWWVMVHRVAKSQTRLSMHAQVLLSDVAATPHPVTLPGPWLVAVVCLGS